MSKGATITVRITEEMKERLEAVAAAKDIPISQIVREAVKEYIQKGE
jgi:predicted DNA-binding protein